MVNIKFIPKEDDQKLVDATAEYEYIWEKDGKRIVEVMQKVSGLNFKEKDVEAIVYEGVSFSGKNASMPMRLRASYSIDVKKATLIHELGHRLLFDIDETKCGLDSHRLLFLILYDIWVELGGKEFADKQVGIESGRKGKNDYEGTWKWALAMSKEDRAKKFREIARGLAS